MQTKTLEQYLDNIDYSYLNSSKYIPTEFALNFMNFIKLVNGKQGESNKTPPMHLAMLDKIGSESPYVVNLCFRGSGKTTLMMEYLTLYLAVFNYLPGFGEISGFIYVSDSMENGVKSARKNIESRYNNSEFLQEWIPKADFTDPYLEFTNKEGKKLGVKMFGSKTGIRGTKIFGKRPQLAILDDLIGDKDSGSRASMDLIKATVYKGVMPALDPKHKVIFNGTPFNKEDIILEAVESGAWEVNVWPICEQFPCEEKDFVGAWEDRFSFEKVKQQYNLLSGSGQPAAFYQEYMLQITSDEDRLVRDDEIQWYERKALLKNIHNFNFYITTDFATSKKETADYSVISVWAYNANGDWFWVDGFLARTTMDVSINKLFEFVQMYRPQSVGIEVTGQQGAFIQWLQSEMLQRNSWFNFASSSPNSNAPGIRPTIDKLSRFNLIVPLFKMGKMYFPKEAKDSPVLVEGMSEIRLATQSGLKGKDDFLDTISMLSYMNPWKPSEATLEEENKIQNFWGDEIEVDPKTNLDSYIV